MEFEEYKIMYGAEDTHWWYRSLRAAMHDMLRLDRAPRDRVHILDAGCGTGGNMNALRASGFVKIEGFDFSETALHFCRLRGLESVRQGAITDIPFASERFDIAISCDVLNDAGLADDHAALRELFRVLKPGGRLFLNLPALKWLVGEHDIAASVARRYTRAEIGQKLKDAGFEVRRATYRYTLLFPVIVAVRRLRRGRQQGDGEPARSDVVLPPAPVNAALSAVMSIERRLLRRVDLPVGSSLSVVAVKPRG